MYLLKDLSKYVSRTITRLILSEYLSSYSWFYDYDLWTSAIKFYSQNKDVNISLEVYKLCEQLTLGAPTSWKIVSYVAITKYKFIAASCG